MPKTNTKQRILDYAAQFGEVSPHQWPSMVLD